MDTDTTTTTEQMTAPVKDTSYLRAAIEEHDKQRWKSQCERADRANQLKWERLKKCGTKHNDMVISEILKYNLNQPWESLAEDEKNYLRNSKDFLYMFTIDIDVYYSESPADIRLDSGFNLKPKPSVFETLFGWMR